MFRMFIILTGSARPARSSGTIRDAIRLGYCLSTSRDGSGDNDSQRALTEDRNNRAHSHAALLWEGTVSRESMWERIRAAWSMLARPRPDREITPGRPRESPPTPAEDELAIAAEGFAEEALPWLDAVYRFSMRLTRGDQDAAEDLVQDTFLRAHRFWHRYERGTNAKSWLFTICRNTYLHQKELVRNQRERPAADMHAPVEALSAASALKVPPPDPEKAFFARLIDEEVVEAIDALPEEFREVLVLSDLGDLKYSEIAQVLDIPLGTAKSRLFRARKLLQDRLREFAVESGYVRETT